MWTPEGEADDAQLLQHVVDRDALAWLQRGTSAVARAVALRVLQYRIVHGITQTKLATQLGLKQSAVARLELGEVTPSFDTLVRLAEGLDIELLIDINPGNRRSKLISAIAERDGVKTSTRNGGRVLVAATS